MPGGVVDSAGEIQKAIQTAAENAVKNMLANAAPMSEARTASAGTATTITRQDHQHPRLTSSTGLHTTDAAGNATVMFTREFTPVVNATFPNGTLPGLAVFPVEDNASPNPTFKALRFLKADGSTWTKASDGNVAGVVLYATRPQNLPILTPVSGILTAVITGVNALVTTLTGFQTTAPAAGVKFTLIALQTSASPA